MFDEMCWEVSTLCYSEDVGIDCGFSVADDLRTNTEFSLVRLI